MIQPKRKPLKDWDKDKLLEELKRVCNKLGKSPTQEEFNNQSNLCKAQVIKKIFGWNNALQQAGLSVIRTQGTITENEIFERMDSYRSQNPINSDNISRNDFIEFCNKNYLIKMKRGIIESRFGSWNNFLLAYNKRVFTDETRQNIKTESAQTLSSPNHDQSSDSKVSFPTGSPTGSKIYVNAPLNEQGVVCLFAILAEKLDFIIQGVRTEFPDCYAKRKIKVNKRGEHYEDCYIEFEFNSSSYRGVHPIRKGYIIVCWEHDWIKDFPEELEVICLKDELNKLNSR
jgi:hypothetical protein